MLRSSALALAACFALAPSAGADSLSRLPPADEYTLSVQGVRETLAPYQSLPEMAVFAGANPVRCVPVDRPSLICVWSLSKKQVGWRPLATALGTGDRLNLVCQFPADGTPRATASCSAHPRRSNRTWYRAQREGNTSGARRSNRSDGDFELDAHRLLDRAVSVFDLSTLVGDAPTSCLIGDDESLCTWRTDASTYGHGTVALIIGAAFSKKVTLLCRLPLDGGPRAPDACSASVGG